MNKINSTFTGNTPKAAEPTVPADFRKVLSGASSAEAAWRDLTPIARHDFIRWIVGAKQSETRKRRIERACDMLMKGKRRPCCYSMVPMEFYRALGTNSKAKAQWRVLAPTTRRDLVSWIESVKPPETSKSRIEKVCSMLAKGEGKVK
ncbi:MAG: YdeI/OmpD-associated family protein [Patescibacteria group bacterium]